MNKTSTWHLKVVSVIMAMLLWLFITNENVIIKQQDVAGVSLKCINLSPGCIVFFDFPGILFFGPPH
jgi:hypothetical protein